MTLVALEYGPKLPDSHPWPHKDAYQCDKCKGCSYPKDPTGPCPYCETEDE